MAQLCSTGTIDRSVNPQIGEKMLFFSYECAFAQTVQNAASGHNQFVYRNQFCFTPSVDGYEERKEYLMDDMKFLTAEEVSARYRGSISVGTLRNWRALRIGPSFVKIGKAVLYPTAELEAWDLKNRVKCRDRRTRNSPEGDAE